jgi:5-methyltetrahydrofolate--homocysteine methyltransferase
MAICSMRSLLKRVREGERLIADGGMGSELIRKGVPPEDTLRANLHHSEVVREIHRSYLAAGADILTANTFGLREADVWADAICAGAAMAVQEADLDPHDVGIWLSFPGSVLPREMETLHLLKSEALYWSRAILIETCVSLPQAIEAVLAAKLLEPELLAVTCHFRADGLLPDGTTPEASAQALVQAGADIVGGNCGDTPETFIEIAARMRQVTDAPLLFQPNAGLPTPTPGGEWVYPVGPDLFAEIADCLFQAGVNIVGGCCGTTPQHIQALHPLRHRQH